MDSIHLGQAAKRLLEDESFKLVMQELRDELVGGWKQTQPDDVKGREEIYFLNLALSHLEYRLQAKVDNLKIIKSKDKDKK